MASNTITTSKNNYSLVIEAVENSYSVANNTSNVTVTLSLKANGTRFVQYWCNGGIFIDGASVATYDNYVSISGSYESVTLATYTGDVSHNSDGEKTLSISGSLTCASGTYSAGSGTVSLSLPLTTIPRASKLTVNEGTLGVSHPLTVNRHADTFTHTITWSCGELYGVVCSNSSATSVNWTEANGNTLSLASQNTKGDKVNVVFKITTYNNGSEIGSYTTPAVAFAIPDSVKPSCALEISDIMGYESIYGSPVKGLSRLGGTVIPMLAYGSPIASYNTSANGLVYTEEEFTTDALKSPGTMTIKATVTDSRGRTSDEATVTKNVLDYTAPVISALTAERCNANGTRNPKGGYIKVTFSAEVTPLNNRNTAEYYMNYKVPGAVDYTGSAAFDDLYGQYSVDGYTYIFAATAGIVYEVEVTVEDAHLGRMRSATARTASMMEWDLDDLSVKFNGDLYDKNGMAYRNGLAAYTGGGDAGIDPDTTLEELCLTSHTHAPQGLGTFYYIHTVFYNTKSATAARTQIAFPYSKTGSIYHRYYASGEWSSWGRYMTASEAWPVGSYYISHNDTSPASLFGGTWHRIESRFLWGAPATSTLGLTAGEQTHTLTINEMPAHTHPVSYGITTGNPGMAVTVMGNGAYRSNIAESAGGGAAHNNMPPYVNVAIWRRTA